MAGTDSSKEVIFKPGPAVILCEPQLGENIGAAARAMANFGLWDLRLVNPRDGWPNERAIASAASADHVVKRVRVFDTVEEAVADLSLVFATTARKRDMFKDVVGPDVATDRMAAHIGSGAAAGMLFGREKWGLNNEEVALSDAIVTLPVEAAFASLNISQAVLVLAYEWRRASGAAEELLFEGDRGRPATKEEMLGLYEHLEESLERAGFFKPVEKKPSMVNNVRTMLSRGGFNQQEVRTFRGIIAALDRRHERPNPNRARSGKSKD